jgi:hypothetical protein
MIMKEEERIRTTNKNKSKLFWVWREFNVIIATSTVNLYEIYTLKPTDFLRPRALSNLRPLEMIRGLT